MIGVSLLNAAVSVLIVFVIGLIAGFLVRKLIVAAIVIAAVVLFIMLLGIVSPSGMSALVKVIGFSIGAAAFLSALLLSLGPIMIIIFLVGFIIGFLASR
ncbi:hypothetical protein [Caldivirga sp. UBA161]|uniref:hypothetical protein n=1 Tax=Caldivirga sp. UBA161 TaxID=1915569 RepID=UPI0025C6FCF6|nr:hypothetical protein [Caldivirga sp. UBA161]